MVSIIAVVAVLVLLFVGFRIWSHVTISRAEDPQEKERLRQGLLRNRDEDGERLKHDHNWSGY